MSGVWSGAPAANNFEVIHNEIESFSVESGMKHGSRKEKVAFDQFTDLLG